jgi:ribosomal protein L37AE/L43A
VRNKDRETEQISLDVFSNQSEHHITMTSETKATEQKNAGTQRHLTGCPGCGHTLVRPTEQSRVFTCAKCGAIFGDCYLGDSYAFVLPFMIAKEPHTGEMRYYDFTCLGSNGLTRRHGWFDPATKMIVQVG